MPSVTQDLFSYTINVIVCCFRVSFSGCVLEMWFERWVNEGERIFLGSCFSSEMMMVSLEPTVIHTIRKRKNWKSMKRHSCREWKPLNHKESRCWVTSRAWILCNVSSLLKRIFCCQDHVKGRRLCCCHCLLWWWRKWLKSSPSSSFLAIMKKDHERNQMKGVWMEGKMREEE